MTSTRYDRIGRSYTRTRRTEPRIQARIDAALGDVRRIVNVGAGTGSYEPIGPEVVAVEPVPVPCDCVDGFAACYWSRPEAYVDPDVQAGISCLAMLEPDVLARGTAQLRADLASGAWDARHGHLRTLFELDVGYRLIVAGS